MFSLNDRVEMTAKFRLEHAQRGYDWHDMVEETEGLTPQDLLWARYPSDEELADVGVRGIYLGNYVDWEANAQTDADEASGASRSRRSRSSAPTGACRTSTTCTRTASTTTSSTSSSATAAAPTTRARTSAPGKMTRDEAIEMVERYDHVKPRKDLERWLEYVGMTEEEFDAIADTLPRPARLGQGRARRLGQGLDPRVRRPRRAAARADRLRETDIRPDELMAEQARRYAADVAWLLERRDRFVAVALPGLRRDRVGAALGQVRPRLPPLHALRDRLRQPAPRPGAARRVLPHLGELRVLEHGRLPGVRGRRGASGSSARAPSGSLELRAAPGTLVDVGAGYGTFCEEVARARRVRSRDRARARAAPRRRRAAPRAWR